MIGKGAAQAYADSIIRQFVDKVQIPVLSTSMGRGVVPDNHPLSVIAARSLALAKADVVLVMGARYVSMSLYVVAPCMLLLHCEIGCYVQLAGWQVALPFLPVMAEFLLALCLMVC